MSGGDPQAVGGKLMRSHDLTNCVFGDLTAIRPTDRREGTSIVWECSCAACGRATYRSARALRLQGATACLDCTRELMAGVRAMQRASFIEVLLDVWERTGDLYFYDPEDLPIAWMAPPPLDVEEPTEYKPDTEARQVWAQMYPIRSEGGWLCYDCGGLFTAGLGCALCVEPVCRGCVRGERHTRHFNDGLGYTLADVGRLLCPGTPISVERVRQIEMRALAKLVHFSRCKRFGLEL